LLTLNILTCMCDLHPGGSNLNIALHTSCHYGDHFKNFSEV
jgi:hypothetical protein